MIEVRLAAGEYVVVSPRRHRTMVNDDKRRVFCEEQQCKDYRLYGGPKALSPDASPPCDTSVLAEAIRQSRRDQCVQL